MTPKFATVNTRAVAKREKQYRCTVAVAAKLVGVSAGAVIGSFSPPDWTDIRHEVQYTRSTAVCDFLRTL